jgi:hypothetical protein
MIKLELTEEVAADVASLLAREAEGYTSVEEHLPERIKSIKEAVEQITTQLDNND